MFFFVILVWFGLVQFGFVFVFGWLVFIHFHKLLNINVCASEAHIYFPV